MIRNQKSADKYNFLGSFASAASIRTIEFCQGFENALQFYFLQFETDWGMINQSDDE